MSITTDALELPSGTRLYQLSTVAESWDAWDQLQGFEVKSWWVDADSNQCDHSMPGARFHQHLEREHALGGRLTVYPPPYKRPAGADHGLAM